MFCDNNINGTNDIRKHCAIIGCVNLADLNCIGTIIVFSMFRRCHFLTVADYPTFVNGTYKKK